MSRSRKKRPITGKTCCRSEKKDKQLANRSLRIQQKQAIHHRKDVMPDLKEVSDIYSWGKDGKTDWSGSDYETMAIRK